MTIRNNNDHYPFAGAGTVFSSPLGPSDFEPKEWGTTAFMPDSSVTIVDNTKDFFAAGILVGDPVFIVGSQPNYRVATVVTGVPFATQIDTAWIAPQDLFNVIYKVGEKSLHSFSSLLNIIIARGRAAYTIHWSRCWCSDGFARFRSDERGDIYVIDPEEERKLNGKNRVAAILADRPTPEELAAAEAFRPPPP